MMSFVIMCALVGNSGFGTLNPKITPCRGSFCAIASASDKSFLFIGPMLLFLIGICFSLSSNVRASRLPSESALIMIPSSPFWINTSPTSVASSALASFKSPDNIGIPATAFSAPGATMRTPLAAVIVLTVLNFVFFSRSSDAPSGSSSAFTFVCTGSSSVPTMMLSPCVRLPS